MTNSLFSHTELEILSGIHIAFSIPSLFGSLFIVFCYWYFKHLRSFAFQLVLFMSISDILYSIGNLMGNQTDCYSCCLLQAFLIAFSNLAIILWCGSISVTLHLLLIRRQSDQIDFNISKFWYWYHSVCWGIPLLLSILPFTTKSYGNAGSWCWISTNKSNTTSTVWRFVQFYIPLWITILYSASVHLKVRRIIIEYRNAQLKYLGVTSEVSETSETEIVPTHESIPGNIHHPMEYMSLYPIALILCYIFPTINRIYEIFVHDKPIVFLHALHAISSGVQGLVNAVKTNIKQLFHEKCGIRFVRSSLASTGITDQEEHDMEIEMQELSAFSNDKDLNGM